MKTYILKSLLPVLLIASTASADSAKAETKAQLVEKYRHEPTQEELQNVFQNFKPNEASRSPAPNDVGWRPAQDTANFKYVLISSEAGFEEASNLRYTIAKNLPEGVKLVLLVSSSNAESVKRDYSQYISADRIILAKDSSIDGGFWARDAFPYPLVDGQGKLSLAGAKYYRSFRSSPAIASTLNLNMSKNNFTFVGGNLIADENANCFTIDSYRRFTSTDDDLKNVYGCKVVHVLKHYSGIGDVDEVVKPIGNNTILTNTPEYANDFKAWGYNVVLLPDVPDSYRTYANSLIVGKTVFMPTYGLASDKQAQAVYEGLGYKVFGIPSNSMSDDMHGSVHCQTMAYPAVNEQQLMQFLNLEKIN